MLTILQKVDLIRETQIGEFEASIQPRIEEEKPEEKKRIKRRRGGEDEGQYKKPRKAQLKISWHVILEQTIVNYKHGSDREYIML